MSLPDEQYNTKQLKLDINLVRGDTLSLKLFQAANQDETPFTLDGYSFAMHVRPAPRARKLILEALNINFFISQSQAAINYDIAQSNPAGTTKDELNLKIDSDKTKVNAGKWVYDIEITDNFSDVQTPIYGNFVITQDVTRINE